MQLTEMSWGFPANAAALLSVRLVLPACRSSCHFVNAHRIACMLARSGVRTHVCMECIVSNSVSMCACVQHMFGPFLREDMYGRKIRYVVHVCMYTVDANLVVSGNHDSAALTALALARCCDRLPLDIDITRVCDKTPNFKHWLQKNWCPHSNARVATPERVCVSGQGAIAQEAWRGQQEAPNLLLDDTRVCRQLVSHCHHCHCGCNP